MKKSISIILVLFLLVLVVGAVFALDSHANVRADFYMWADRKYPDATGYAVINWIKGKGAWNATVEVWNTRPDSYQLSVGIGGTCIGNTILIEFSVDDTGYGYGHVTGLTNVPNEFNIARIVKLGNGCQTELTAPEVEGLLVPRGSGRYQENGKHNN